MTTMTKTTMMKRIRHNKVANGAVNTKNISVFACGMCEYCSTFYENEMCISNFKSFNDS